jgi:hypothetical protein
MMRSKGPPNPISMIFAIPGLVRYSLQRCLKEAYLILPGKFRSPRALFESLEVP